MFRNTANVFVLCAALIVGSTQPAEAILFGFRQIGDPSCNVPGLVVDVTDEGTDMNGNVIVHFTFHVLEGSGADRLTHVYFDDRCDDGAALMSFDGIINGPGVNFTAPATPANPPNSQLLCPPFSTTNQFSADVSGGTANAVQPGEFVTLIFTLNAGRDFDFLLHCLEEADEDAEPCVPGLRIGINLTAQACGSGGVNLPESVDIGDDCNNNLIPDSCDIDAQGTDAQGRPCSLYGDGIGMSEDVNMDGIPDECQDCTDLGCPTAENLCFPNVCVEGECVVVPVECPEGFCDPDTGECVDCLENSDCDQSDLCNPEACIEGECVPVPVECPEGFCDPDTGECVDCLENSDCDQSDLCNPEACIEGECVPEPVECPEGFCDPDTGECVDCLEDFHCDDGDLCTNDLCVDGECTSVPVDCDDGFCDPDTGECVECIFDEDCDDGDPCTIDTCVTDVGPRGVNGGGGFCVNEPIICDDGDLCTTDECVDGNCVFTPVECPEGFCDPDTGECVECLENADCDDGNVCNGMETCVEGVCQAGTPLVCDDGLFCNGVETCDPVAGCQPGTNPCQPDDFCDEVNDICVPPEPPPQPVPGACCLPDGTCEPVVEDACANQGGTFRGEGVACADADCPQPPPPPQPTPCPGGLSLLFSHLAGAPVCGMGCLAALPMMILGLMQLRSRRRMRRRAR